MSGRKETAYVVKSGVRIVAPKMKRAWKGMYGGRTIGVGHKVSFSNKKKLRTWEPNVHRATLFSEILGHTKTFKATTFVLKNIDKKGGLDNYLLKSSDQTLRVDPFALDMREMLRGRLRGAEARGMRLPDAYRVGPYRTPIYDRVGVIAPRPFVPPRAGRGPGAPITYVAPSTAQLQAGMLEGATPVKALPASKRPVESKTEAQTEAAAGNTAAEGDAGAASAGAGEAKEEESQLPAMTAAEAAEEAARSGLLQPAASATRKYRNGGGMRKNKQRKPRDGAAASDASAAAAAPVAASSQASAAPA